ncbi:MAG: GNAT family N-acetyltransferase [Promethearchaeota archaeon]|nr:MAG: GNAT family N-acetyltransferase [Candidatus Lokiarchaeota archaeon]
MIIREFTERDIDEITQLMKKLCSLKDQDFDETRWRMSLEKHMREDTNTEVLVAFDKDTNTVAGMAFASIKNSEKGFRFGYLSNLIVKEEARRSGIGETILAHTIDYFKRHHVDSIRLSLAPQITNGAKKLLAKFGFEEIFKIYELRI